MKTVGWALLLLLLTLPASGQEVRGNISGTVRDAGGVLPGASIEITNVDTASLSIWSPTRPDTSRRHCFSRATIRSPCNSKGTER